MLRATGGHHDLGKRVNSICFSHDKGCSAPPQSSPAQIFWNLQFRSSTAHQQPAPLTTMLRCPAPRRTTTAVTATHTLPTPNTTSCTGRLMAKGESRTTGSKPKQPQKGNQGARASGEREKGWAHHQPHKEKQKGEERGLDLGNGNGVNRH